MKYQLECEEKFFCEHTNDLISFILNNLSFSFKAKLKEEDIYLTDKENHYIQENACLRIRKTNNSFLELTRKSLLNKDERFKIEKNIPFPIQKEKRLLNLLSHIGITEFCRVLKTRTIYSKKINNLTYNIVLDLINNQTSFIEFEIISDKYQDDLEKKLNNFISKFKKFSLKKAHMNYRDFTLNSKQINKI